MVLRVWQSLKEASIKILHNRILKSFDNIFFAGYVIPQVCGYSIKNEHNTRMKDNDHFHFVYREYGLGKGLSGASLSSIDETSNDMNLKGFHKNFGCLRIYWH